MMPTWDELKRMLDHALELISKLQRENEFLRRQNETLFERINERESA